MFYPDPDFRRCSGVFSGVKPGKRSWRGCLARYSQLSEKEAKSLLGRLLDPDAEAGTGSGCLKIVIEHLVHQGQRHPGVPGAVAVHWLQ